MAEKQPVRVPFLDPPIRQPDVDDMLRSLRSGWLAHGEWSERFENAFADYLGTPHAVMVSSCTGALHIALRLAGVGGGDEVVTTPVSWVATSNVVLLQRAVPVFADVDGDTGLLDPESVERNLTPRTRAILPVHLFGQMADMTALAALAERHGLAVIEDAAHAIEAQRDGVRPGQASRAACFSFHVGKNITCGQGGALVTRDGREAARAKLLRRQGVINRDDVRVMEELGFKYESTDFQAALLVGQLRRIEESLAARRRVFERYERGFRGSGVRVLRGVPNARHACNVFVVRVPPSRRDAIRTAMAERGIETSILYRPIYQEPFYRRRLAIEDGRCPEAERFGETNVALPTYPTLTEERQETVIRTLLSLL